MRGFGSGIFSTLIRLLSHPLGRRDRVGVLDRFFRWQVGSRLVNGPVAVPFVNGTRLLVSSGMRGATGNIYTGLIEFEDMAFVLHFMREEDLFLDVGANVGVYSVLAASRGSSVIAIEPVPSSYEGLLDNIFLNRFHRLVEPKNVGVGGKAGTLRFSASMGPTNHVVAYTEVSEEGLDVAVETLDEIAVRGGEKGPRMLKIDVEGFEEEVLRGADEVLRKESLQAVLIEINGLGARYGFSDSDIHARLLGHGFKPVSYDPFARELATLEDHNESGNTLYVRSPGDLKGRLEEAPVIRLGKTKF